MTTSKFNVGDTVTWTNEQGIDMGVRTITEVMRADDGPQRYRLSDDIPWMYVREFSLELAPDTNTSKAKNVL